MVHVTFFLRFQKFEDKISLELIIFRSYIDQYFPTNGSKSEDDLEIFKTSLSIKEKNVRATEVLL